MERKIIEEKINNNDTLWIFLRCMSLDRIAAMNSGAMISKLIPICACSRVKIDC